MKIIKVKCYECDWDYEIEKTESITKGFPARPKRKEENRIPATKQYINGEPKLVTICPRCHRSNVFDDEK